jgi:hypothetical protein
VGNAKNRNAKSRAAFHWRLRDFLAGLEILFAFGYNKRIVPIRNFKNQAFRFEEFKILQVLPRLKNACASNPANEVLR